MPSEKPQTNRDKKVRPSIREPERYDVVLHNDDFTTMEFVVMLLVTVFHKSESEANTIMLRVHNNGEGVAGTYTYDIAATKIKKSTDMARAEGFPLRLSMRPA
jgi:ATP-dependent Clp protease adaptor protein ClpS